MNKIKALLPLFLIILLMPIRLFSMEEAASIKPNPILTFLNNTKPIFENCDDKKFFGKLCETLAKAEPKVEQKQLEIIVNFTKSFELALFKIENIRNANPKLGIMALEAVSMLRKQAFVQLKTHFFQEATPTDIDLQHIEPVAFDNKGVTSIISYLLPEQFRLTIQEYLNIEKYATYDPLFVHDFLCLQTEKKDDSETHSDLEKQRALLSSINHAVQLPKNMQPNKTELVTILKYGLKNYEQGIKEKKAQDKQKAEEIKKQTESALIKAVRTVDSITAKLGVNPILKQQLDIFERLQNDMAQELKDALEDNNQKLEIAAKYTPLFENLDRELQTLQQLNFTEHIQNLLDLGLVRFAIGLDQIYKQNIKKINSQNPIDQNSIDLTPFITLADNMAKANILASILAKDPALVNQLQEAQNLLLQNLNPDKMQPEKANVKANVQITEFISSTIERFKQNLSQLGGADLTADNWYEELSNDVEKIVSKPLNPSHYLKNLWLAYQYDISQLPEGFEITDQPLNAQFLSWLKTFANKLQIFGLDKDRTVLAWIAILQDLDEDNFAKAYKPFMEQNYNKIVEFQGFIKIAVQKGLDNINELQAAKPKFDAQTQEMLDSLKNKLHDLGPVIVEQKIQILTNFKTTIFNPAQQLVREIGEKPDQQYLKLRLMQISSGGPQLLDGLKQFENLNEEFKLVNFLLGKVKEEFTPNRDLLVKELPPEHAEVAAVEEAATQTAPQQPQKLGWLSALLPAGTSQTARFDTWKDNFSNGINKLMTRALYFKIYDSVIILQNILYDFTKVTEETYKSVFERIRPQIQAVTRNIEKADLEMQGKREKARLKDFESLFLQNAASPDDETKQLKNMLDEKVNIETTNLEGQTALIIAAKAGKAAKVKFLLDNGAKPNASDNNDGTPLTAAIMNFDVNPNNCKLIIELLIKNPATTIEHLNNAAQVAQTSRNPIPIRLINTERGNRLLLDAYKKNDTTYLDEIIKLGPDIETINKVLTPTKNRTFIQKLSEAKLLTATQNGDWKNFDEAFQIIIFRDFNLNVKNTEGDTALMIACKKYGAEAPVYKGIIETLISSQKMTLDAIDAIYQSAKKTEPVGPGVNLIGDYFGKRVKSQVWEFAQKTTLERDELKVLSQAVKYMAQNWPGSVNEKIGDYTILAKAVENNNTKVVVELLKVHEIKTDDYDFGLKSYWSTIVNNASEIVKKHIEYKEWEQQEATKRKQQEAAKAAEEEQERKQQKEKEKQRIADEDAKRKAEEQRQEEVTKRKAQEEELEHKQKEEEDVKLKQQEELRQKEEAAAKLEQQQKEQKVKEDTERKAELERMRKEKEELEHQKEVAAKEEAERKEKEELERKQKEEKEAEELRQKEEKERKEKERLEKPQEQEAFMVIEDENVALTALREAYENLKYIRDNSEADSDDNVTASRWMQRFEFNKKMITDVDLAKVKYNAWGKVSWNKYQELLKKYPKK